MGALTHNGEVLQRLPADASQINFDNTGTNLNSTQTENAIKEVNTKVNTNTDDIDELKSGLNKIKVISITAPSDLTSTAVGGNAEIPIEAGYNGHLVVGVYLYAHAQNRGVLGYFNQSTIVNNTIVLLDLNKQITDSDFNSASGFALVVDPS